MVTAPAKSPASQGLINTERVGWLDFTPFGTPLDGCCHHLYVCRWVLAAASVMVMDLM
jgi:hypothetical protein